MKKRVQIDIIKIIIFFAIIISPSIAIEENNPFILNYNFSIYNISFNTPFLKNESNPNGNKDFFVLSVSHRMDLPGPAEKYIDIIVEESEEKLTIDEMFKNIMDEIGKEGTWQNADSETYQIDDKNGVFGSGTTQLPTSPPSPSLKERTPIYAAQYTKSIRSAPYKEKQVLIVIHHLNEDQAKSLLKSFKLVVNK